MSLFFTKLKSIIKTQIQSDRFYSALVRGLSNYFDIVQVALSNHSNMTQQAKYKILSDIRKFKDKIHRSKSMFRAKFVVGLHGDSREAHRKGDRDVSFISTIIKLIET